MSTRGVAVVTGASSGIGLASVAALAADDWHVVGTARDPRRSVDLAELATAVGAQVCPLDVTSPTSVGAFVRSILDEHGEIELLVNNAGVGHRGTLEQLTDEDVAASFEVNFWGVVRTTRAVLPGMRTHGSGRIITVTSTNGVIGMPFSDAYNAAKFAVEGLMEGLAPVLRQFGVMVSVLEPGPVRTSFLRNAMGHTAEVAHDDPYAALLNRYNGMMAGLLSSGEAPDDVGAVVARIAREPHPHLRYQSSDSAAALIGRKLIDPTGDSVVDATSALLLAPS